MTEVVETYPVARVGSGHPRIDEVFGGGLPANSVTVLAGLPGSGKTLLAQQYVFANATEHSPAVYLTTVSEPLDKVIRYGQELTFFDIDLVNSAVFYADAGAVLSADGLPGFLKTVTGLLAAHTPGVLVIDSFKALRSYATDEGEFRRFLNDLSSRLAAQPVTSLWLGEYTDAEIGESAEFAVADAIIRLGTNVMAERRMRVLTVLKLRGSGFLSGQHAYRLSNRGLDLFPRLADGGAETPYQLDGHRVSTGIPNLDDLVGGGYHPGGSALVAGPPGVGKTIAALHFLRAGTERGERGLFAAMQENPVQLARTAAGFGWTLRPGEVDVVHHVPVDLYVDEWMYEILDRVQRDGIRRLVIDSLGDLQNAAPDTRRFQEMFYSFVQRCSRLGVTVLMTLEVPDLFGPARLSDNGVTHLSDNVVLLQYLRGDSRIKKAITILKARASRHDLSVREYSITDTGITLGDAFGAEQDLR
ncbi:ATPase domain-containing protein [Actinoplanes derwentensis]|uniref:non-specific serine/threonine protein kinase n=1 Tax=Actinoplanes derwentensis TaxID=113562 RepID=A0A1H1Z389_9ACTN|nr:ATPase domain-containing protein [Actinoplanes derwentensis]GID81409.1 circadian clock protein KaiC [Actinoplanes derwentensis]SDT28118.1 circadian clock protein KaiC [Actinoplanes derwentensis]